MARVALSGPPIAATYRLKGGRKDYAHHVQETTAGELVCVEHLSSDCHNCGRTPAEHEEIAAKVASGNHPHPRDYGDCEAHEKRPACRCDLPKWGRR